MTEPAREILGERRELIERQWKKWVYRTRRAWPKNCDVLRVPIELPLSSAILYDAKIQDMTPVQDRLEFRREYGRFEGKEAVRVVCEGHVVEMDFLDAASIRGQG